MGRIFSRKFDQLTLLDIAHAGGREGRLDPERDQMALFRFAECRFQQAFEIIDITDVMVRCQDGHYRIRIAGQQLDRCDPDDGGGPFRHRFQDIVIGRDLIRLG